VKKISIPKKVPSFVPSQTPVKKPVCPYCGGDSELVDSSIIYKTSYGPIYLCKPCWAYVGVHKGTNIPLGRLANKELRLMKNVAHIAFDHLWGSKMDTQQISKHKARNESYRWLSEQMGLHKDDTHIGMFDVEQCLEVIRICSEHITSQPVLKRIEDKLNGK